MNNVFVFGELASKISDRSTATGKRVVGFILKITETNKGKDYSQWIPVQAWSVTAEKLLSLNLCEGQGVIVVGKLGSQKEKEVWRTIIVAQDIIPSDRNTSEFEKETSHLVTSKPADTFTESDIPF